jgi:hypothetical protein
MTSNIPPWLFDSLCSTIQLNFHVVGRDQFATALDDACPDKTLASRIAAVDRFAAKENLII